MTYQERLASYCALTEAALARYLTPEESCAYATIYDAVKYSALAGGKRLRPALLLEFCRVCGGRRDDALPFAAALEMIHTYSLIHDDLPCMDNDDLRRGKPTNHKVFGEAMAVLAGDALLTRAFETVLDPENTKGLPPAATQRAAFRLARAAGMDGMVGGQVIDLESEGKHVPLERLTQLQALKTGKLITVACTVGCAVGGCADAALYAAAEAYGGKLGLAFQIEDDILDIEGDAAALGKTTGKDEKSQKSTFPSLLGLDTCKRRVRELTGGAVEAARAFPHSDFLIELAESLVSRDR